MFNTIEASFLRKAALMVSKDMPRTNIVHVRVTAATVEATDGHMAFRAFVNLGIDEAIFLAPKRKLPVGADVVEINPEDIMHSRVVSTKGLSLGVLLEYFDLAESHVFPNLDKVIQPAPESDEVGFSVDMHLLARVANGDKGPAEVKVVPGKDNLAPVGLSGRGWAATIMPLQP